MTDPVRVRALVTPPINTTGVFAVYAPYTLPAGAVYRCEAIRAFDELRVRNIDVFTTYYQPFGLSETLYREDAGKGASIVTLVGADGTFVYIPNTFIESYPGMSGIRYENKLLLFNLGPLPEAMNIDYLIPVLGDAIKQATGVDSTRATVEFVTNPMRDNITHEQHIQLEATRQLAILQHVPLVEQIANLTVMLAAKQKEIDDLTGIISAYPELTA